MAAHWVLIWASSIWRRIARVKPSAAHRFTWYAPAITSAASVFRRLTQVNTRNAKRRLRKNTGKERRFQRDVNHCVSKTLVAKAAISRTAIALEDLSGIRERVAVRRAHRYERHSWAFFQLRQFLAYKAAWAGVPVRLVDPRNTSRTCSACGNCEKANRRSQAEFLCQRCGFTLNADYNAAINISRKEWAAVNQPLASPLAG